MANPPPSSGGLLPEPPINGDPIWIEWAQNVTDKLGQFFVTLNAPAIVTGLVATANPTTIFLQWNASNGASAYRIYRNTTGDFTTAQIIQTVGGSKTGIATLTTQDSYDTSGSTRYYWVQGVNERGVTGPQSTMATIVRPLSGLIVDYFLVAGGGGGGNSSTAGGGGGGGELLTVSNRSIASGTYAVVIGSGGAVDTVGNVSTFNGSSAAGGGKGGANGAGGNGACGGGGGFQAGGFAGGAGSAGAAGGNGGSSSGGGGGGMGGGAAGGGSANHGGNGGNGLAAPWGSFGSFAGGGGGDTAGVTTPLGGTGMDGGGNGGASFTGVSAGTGTPNSGGGGGGGSTTSGATPAAGGSGFFALRYVGDPMATGGTIVTVDGYTYHSFITSGSFVI